MAIEFKLPELGENIEGGDVTSVLVAVGDVVTEGQSILEIEAGKASMEIPSPADGTITAVHIAQGDNLAVGQLAFTIEGGAAESSHSSGSSRVPSPHTGQMQSAGFWQLLIPSELAYVP